MLLWVNYSTDHMDLLSSLILGVVQGLTEFLPISSTGHLILARDFLNLTGEHGLAIDAVLHLATAMAVLIYFRREIWTLIIDTLRLVQGKEVEAKSKTLIGALVIGTIPAVVFGLLLESNIETVFRNINLVAYALIGGSILFIFAEVLAKKTEQLSIRKGVAIGFFQALALIPGVSRSGATISGGLLLGLTREDAARFAFLLSFPVILGAGLLKLFELSSAGTLVESGFSIALGAIAAFVTGLLAIHYLLKYLRSHTLGVFVVYRLGLAAIILLFL